MSKIIKMDDAKHDITLTIYEGTKGYIGITTNWIETFTVMGRTVEEVHERMEHIIECHIEEMAEKTRIAKIHLSKGGPDTMSVEIINIPNEDYGFSTN